MAEASGPRGIVCHHSPDPAPAAGRGEEGEKPPVPAGNSIHLSCDLSSSSTDSARLGVQHLHSPESRPDLDDDLGSQIPPGHPRAGAPRDQGNLPLPRPSDETPEAVFVSGDQVGRR